MSLAAMVLAGLSYSARAANSYTVFRVCEDQHILKTSDGADCGHIEYIVTDPGEQRIVSTVITGGVIGTHHVCVPFSEFQASGERDFLLRGVTRERIIAAPPIEVDRLRASFSVEPSFIERSSTYFSANVSPGEERGRNLRDVPAERQLPPGERGNDGRGAVRDSQGQLPPGERGAVRDSQRQLPPGERGSVRDPQEQLPPGERGAVRDSQKQLPPEGRTTNPKTAVGDTQENNVPPSNGNGRENGNGAQPRSQGKSGATNGATTGASEARSKAEANPKESESNVQDKPPGTTHRQKNTPNSENANTEKSRAGVGKAVDSEGARSEGAATKEKKAEGTQKAEPNEDSPTRSKKGESVKEDKPSARPSTDKGERKEPKSDEQR